MRQLYRLFAAVGCSSLVLAAAPQVGGCQIFPSDHIFNTRIDSLPVHPDSAAYLQTISSSSRRLHLDLGQTEDMGSSSYYGIPYNTAHGNSITWQSLFYSDGWPDESDCAKADHQINQPCAVSSGQPQMPIPASPKVEGGIEPNPANYGDHHILVVDQDSCILWEAYHSYPHTGGGWDVLSTAAFDLKSNRLRPAGWTSSDAAGFPIMPLLLRADEAASGEITHALRFTIQSSKIRAAYVWPARHLTSNGGTSKSKPAMGQLFRLRADYVIPGNYTTQAKAILTAMQRYGMYIADGGSDMYVSGEPSAQWQSDTISQVQTVPHTMFEAVDLAPIMQRSGFQADSAAVPASGNSFSISPQVSGTVDNLTLSASIKAGSEDQGQAGNLYVVAGSSQLPSLYALTAQGWQAISATNIPAYASVTLASHNLAVLSAFNTNLLPGLVVYAGYGRTLADMLANQKYGLLWAAK